MKYRLLDLLLCPSCGGSLDLHTFDFDPQASPAPVEAPPCLTCHHPEFCRRDAISASDCGNCYAHEIKDGILLCSGCKGLYPVIEGIPRFVPDAFEENPEYVQRYRTKLKTFGWDDGQQHVETFRRRYGATKRNFGFQWLRYEVTDEEEDDRIFLMKTGENASSFRGKLVFEGGCGMGRYVRVARKLGAEVVGIDLSGAVVRAYRENRESPFVHIVQGNLMDLLFRKASFDFVYSIGVLHHTPDTREAFFRIAELVMPEGKCAISVYGKIHPLAEFTWRMYRRVLRRLPLIVVHYLCYLAIPKGFVDGWLRGHALTRKIGTLSQCLLPVSPHPKWQVRLCDTFDWYMPQYQRYHTYREVMEWFNACGFHEVRALRNEVWPVNVVGRK